MSKSFFTSESKKETIKKLLFDPKISKHLSSNFLTLGPSKIDELRTSLMNNFFTQRDPDYLETAMGKTDMDDHLLLRLEKDRTMVLPWLSESMQLDGANILEIGCGTGASTVALAEQGANVTGVDIDKLALNDARKRCELYGLEADFHNLNATELTKAFSDRKFDLIVFWASLEHMTHKERMIAMKDSWEMLSPGGFWAITETPNRMHYSDSHTSLLPFYHWLPDDLAIEYSHISPREDFAKSFAIRGEGDDMTKLARWGRGMSFHEFDLAMKPAEQLDIVSSLASYRRNSRTASKLRSKITKDYRYEVFLSKILPSIDRAFFHPYLNLMIRK